MHFKYFIILLVPIAFCFSQTSSLETARKYLDIQNIGNQLEADKFGNFNTDECGVDVLIVIKSNEVHDSAFVKKSIRLSHFQTLPASSGPNNKN